MNKKVLIAFAALFVVALIGQFMFSIYSNLIDKSSYTDWISAFCNVVMAGATVGAVLIARNYLAQFTAQEGYKIAIELVNEVLPEVKELNEIGLICSNSKKILYEIIRDIDFGHVGYIKDRHEYLHSKANNILTLKSEIEEYLFKVGTYGLEPSDERYEDLMNIIDCLDELSSNVGKLGSMLFHVERNLKNIATLSSKLNNENISTMDGVISEIREDTELRQALDNTFNIVSDLNESYENFIKGNHHITNLFVIK
ncbi:hypothetical protein [Yersinia sp. 2541 StPb PI]|uniref:hypothetical protein n=1 Tax=Yersinia sp. 2541 StPb PI TaxID=3117407 RepID=UPI003FA41980